MIKSKKQMFLIIGVFTLILLVTSVTYAFFNYTRTGALNVLRTGNIYFNTTEGTALNITNAFPMTSTEAENATLDSVTVGIVGNTEYSDGEEFLISLVDVNNTVNNKKIPMNYIATYTVANNGTIGTSSNNYWEAREDKDANIYKLSSTGDVINGEKVLVGYIDNTGSGINGTLTIKAYIDADRIAITDTYNGTNTPTDNMGTTSNWVNGRTVFTTTEWNSLTSTGISFKIKAESQEGIWVEEPLSRNDMVNIFLPNSNAFTSEQKATITEINFVRMKEENINTHSNLIDLTASGGEGVVKAWIENNKLYIASPGATWFPVDSSGLLSNFDAVTTINFNNINTSQVTNMMGMISHLPLLTSIDLSKFDTSNVTTMSAMFTGNTSLQSIDLSNLDVGNLTNMVAMFDGCTNLVSVNLSNLNTTNLTYLNSTFSSCSSLTTVNLTNFNTTNVTSYTNMFGGCTSLTTLDLSSFTISSGSSVHAMFTNDSSLTTIYVSNLWNPNNLAGYGIFEGCTSIVGGSGTTYDSSHVDDDYAKVDGGQSNPGYLTLKTN